MRREAFCCLVVAALLSAPVCRAAAGDDKKQPRECDPQQGTVQCGKNERCHQKSANEKSYCDCKRGYVRTEDECVQIVSTVATDTSTDKTDQNSSSGGGSVAAGLLIPTFLLLAGGLLYFAARRYKWVERFRQYRQNRYGNVLVTRDDDDDDDSPIA